MDKFDDTQIQYAIVRVPLDGGKTRDVFLNWVGSRVRTMEKGKKRTFVGDVQKVLSPFHTELTVTGKANFNMATLVERSDPACAMHEIS